MNRYDNIDDCYELNNDDDRCGGCGESMSLDFNPDFYCQVCGAPLCFDCISTHGSSCSTCRGPGDLLSSVIQVPGLEGWTE
jgi:hypothetical protein